MKTIEKNIRIENGNRWATMQWMLSSRDLECNCFNNFYVKCIFAHTFGDILRYISSIILPRERKYIILVCYLKILQHFKNYFINVYITQKFYVFLILKTNLLTLKWQHFNKSLKSECVTKTKNIADISMH